MSTAFNAIDSALNDIDRLRKTLRRKKTRQVQSIEEKNLIKATVLTWFSNYREDVIPQIDIDFLQDADELYKQILSASDHNTSRVIYDNSLKLLRKELSEIRPHTVTETKNTPIQKTTDTPPDFAHLITDPKMQRIMENRWIECSNCMSSNAPLAATVMMGGLLEALLLARINKEPNMSKIFKASKAPKNKKTGNVLPLKEWSLKNYINVTHELNWISQSAKDVGSVLRDYRNYIHPYKEFSHNVVIETKDAILFWEIVKGISRELLG